RLALNQFVVWVKYLADVLRLNLVRHRAVVVAMIEGAEVKRLYGFGFPKTECVASAHSVPEDRRVIDLAPNLRIGNPSDLVPSMLVYARFGTATEFHLVADFWPDDFPRVPET